MSCIEIIESDDFIDVESFSERDEYKNHFEYIDFDQVSWMYLDRDYEY